MNIIFSMGDCNGIGLEVLVKAIIEYDKLIESKKQKANGRKLNEENNTFSIAGNTKTIEDYISHFKFPAQVKNNSLVIESRICPIVKCGKYSKVSFGEESKSAGELATKSIEKALSLTLNGQFDAMVTMPVSKSVLYKAGWKYPGHTEMLAEGCGVINPLMILCKDKLRVGLATIHIPVKDVSRSLTKSGIIETGQRFNDSLKTDFGIKQPKIAVLGLNPHAGENGDIGKEEITKIIPAINELNKKGINAFGPFPADGFFAYGEYKVFDGILAMYHDQGLIPLKLLTKGSGINFTAGLPIVRTSPDHGTGFNIAGNGIADFRSTLNAIRLAIRIVKNRI